MFYCTPTIKINLLVYSRFATLEENIDVGVKDEKGETGVWGVGKL